jgi:ATP-binding cassette, subfamily C, bacterial LapB
VAFAYPGRPPIAIAKLEIAAGEKVAILGPIGAGKSTLLKLLAGLYKPAGGRVLIDDLEMQQIARPALAAQLGYLQQDQQLAAGTLRDNLVSIDAEGKPCADDETILAACRATGLATLIASHPKGLDLEIGEGGTGVSGGQRRLVGLTRLVLSKPSVWLLDEPTSAMDEASERATLALLQRSIEPAQTLILVTHKPQLLALVDRIVVLTETGIALDGPRALVLQALNRNSAPAGALRAAA